MEETTPAVIDRKLKESEITPNKYRKEVLLFLDHFKTHPTATDIFEHVKKKYPHVSLATVYNTLNIFLEKGLVTALRTEGNNVHYDSTIDGHAHFICDRCHKIVDIHKDPLQDSMLKRKKLRGNTVNRVETYYFGLCAECKKEVSSFPGDAAK